MSDVIGRYMAGCHCAACTESAADWSQRIRPLRQGDRIEVTPTGVRLGALSADGAMTAEQVAELLKVEPGWVRAAAREGQIPAHKLGRYWRYDRDEIEAWWSEQSNGHPEIAHPDPSGQKV
jgi:excisionase family DNA binding protein